MVLVPSSFSSIRSTGIKVGRHDFPFTSFRSCVESVSGSVTTTVSRALLGLLVRLVTGGVVAMLLELLLLLLFDAFVTETVAAPVPVINVFSAPPAIITTAFVVCALVVGVTTVDVVVILIKSGGIELTVFFSSDAPASTTLVVGEVPEVLLIVAILVVGTSGGGEGKLTVVEFVDVFIAVGGEGVIVNGCCDD